MIARRDGLAALTLREVADLMGMRPPSLYSHFESKAAVYDAMFAQAWRQLVETFEATTFPAQARKSLLVEAEVFFDFSVSDIARNHLMNLRIMDDFQPSDSAYAESLKAYDRLANAMRSKGITKPADLDLWTALLGGAINQQLANDLGGNRWRRQLPRLVDMFCDEVGVPGPPLRRKR